MAPNKLKDSAIPYSRRKQLTRLNAALALSATKIKTLIWAEDALVFGSRIQTELYPALQLIVKDDEVFLALDTLKESSRYRFFTQPYMRFTESVIHDPATPQAFGKSAFLEPTTRTAPRGSEEHPELIVIHPESEFHWDLLDDSLSIPLAPLSDHDLRTPTGLAFLDAVTATYLDPPSGQVHTCVSDMCRLWLGDFLHHTLQKYPYISDD